MKTVVIAQAGPMWGSDEYGMMIDSIADLNDSWWIRVLDGVTALNGEAEAASLTEDGTLQSTFGNADWLITVTDAFGDVIADQLPLAEAMGKLLDLEEYTASVRVTFEAADTVKIPS